MTFACRLVETRQHQVQADCQAVHGDNFARQGAREASQRRRERLVVAVLRMAAAEMRFDAELGPVPELDLYVEFGAFRLPAERLSAEIDRLLLIDRRDQELLPEFRQRIA